MALAAGSISALAQSETEASKPDLSGEMAPAVDMEQVARQAEGNIGKDGSAQWFVDMDYSGFNFKIPAGTIVEKGSTLVAKYPDGSYGISMANESLPSNQKIAFQVCRRLATEMNIPDAKVNKVSYGRSNGARATGNINGQEVTILVLPYDNQQVTAVVLNTPRRADWTRQFLSTLTR